MSRIFRPIVLFNYPESCGLNKQTLCGIRGKHRICRCLFQIPKLSWPRLYHFIAYPMVCQFDFRTLFNITPNNHLMRDDLSVLRKNVVTVGLIASISFTEVNNGSRDLQNIFWKTLCGKIPISFLVSPQPIILQISRNRTCSWLNTDGIEGSRAPHHAVVMVTIDHISCETMADFNIKIIHILSSCVTIGKHILLRWPKHHGCTTQTMIEVNRWYDSLSPSAVILHAKSFLSYGSPQLVTS